MQLKIVFYTIFFWQKRMWKIIDVVGIGLNLIDIKGKFEFSADGLCNTKCWLSTTIESSIRTKNTAEVISKTMISGVLILF